VLSRYLPAGVEKTELAANDVPDAIAGIFGADPALYLEAAEVFRRYRRDPETGV
jgi:hypothetical protein